ITLNHGFVTLHSSSVTWHSSDFASVKFHVWHWSLGSGEDRNHAPHRARRSSIAGRRVAGPEAPPHSGPSAQRTAQGVPRTSCCTTSTVIIRLARGGRRDGRTQTRTSALRLFERRGNSSNSIRRTPPGKESIERHHRHDVGPE